MTRPKVIMDHGKFANLVRQGQELGCEVVSIFGYGEPLIDKELPEKVAYCTSRGLKTNITTNGSLLDAEMSVRLLYAGLSQIRFSAHGIGVDHEKVHRGLKWIEVIKNIDLFIHENRKNGHDCETHATVIPQHGESIHMIKHFWENRVDYLEIWKPHNWGGMKSYRQIDRKKKTCGRPFGGPIQIMADGRMIVCCYDIDGQMVIGDTNKNSIYEILNGEGLKRIQDKHTKGDYAGLLCDTCDQLNIEEENPLLYSSRDPERKLDCTSSCKEQLNTKGAT